MPATSTDYVGCGGRRVCWMSGSWTPCTTIRLTLSRGTSTPSVCEIDARLVCACQWVVYYTRVLKLPHIIGAAYVWLYGCVGVAGHGSVGRCRGLALAKLLA